MKYVVFYESADNVLAKAPPHLDAHVARLNEFHERGELLMVGTFADPQKQGSMSIFRSREAAEAFVSDDPFRVNGVIAGTRSASGTSRSCPIETGPARPLDRTGVCR